MPLLKILDTTPRAGHASGSENGPPSVPQPLEVPMHRVSFSRPRGLLMLLASATLGWLLSISSARPGENAQPTRQPEPDKGAVAKKEKLLHKMFKEELAKAKTDAQAARELADLLLRE